MFYKVLRTENLGSERGRTLDITERGRTLDITERGRTLDITQTHGKPTKVGGNMANPFNALKKHLIYFKFDLIRGGEASARVPPTVMALVNCERAERILVYIFY